MFFSPPASPRGGKTSMRLLCHSRLTSPLSPLPPFSARLPPPPLSPLFPAARRHFSAALLDSAVASSVIS